MATARRSSEKLPDGLQIPPVSARRGNKEHQEAGRTEQPCAPLIFFQEDSMRMVWCKCCGKMTSSERRAISDSYGYPRIELVMDNHTTGDREGTLCMGSGRDANKAALKTAPSDSGVIWA